MGSDGRAAVYVRLSQDTDTTTSPQRQRADCLALAEARGWEVDESLDVYEDIDESAYRGHGRDRPSYRRLMERLDDYDALVFWKVDRLVRRLTEWSKVMEQADEHGTALVSVQEPGLDTSTTVGKMLATMVAGFGEMESESIALRVASAHRYLMEQGKWRGGVPPFGWRAVPSPDGQGQVLELDSEGEHEALRRCVREVLEGDSVSAQSRWLTSQGWVTTRGNEWRDTSLRRLLRSPVLYGGQTYKGKPVTDEDGKPLVTHEPLISRREWLDLQEALEGRSSKKRRKAGATLLSSFVVCGECGNKMAGRRGDDPSASYQCGGRDKQGAKVCKGCAVKRALLDEFVTEAVLHYLSPERIEAARQRVQRDREQAASNGHDATAARIASVQHSLDELERDRYDRGLYEGDDGAARFTRIHSRLLDELRELKDRRVDRDSAASRLVRAVGGADDVRKLWQGMDTAQRRALIGTVVEAVVVYKGERGGPAGRGLDPDRVRIVWRGQDTREHVRSLVRQGELTRED